MKIMFLISIILILLLQLCIAQVGIPLIPLNYGENQNNGTSSGNDDRNGLRILPLIRGIPLIPLNYDRENQNNGTSSGNDNRNGSQILPMIRGVRGRGIYNRENQNNGSSENDDLQIPALLIRDILDRRQSRQRQSEQL